MEIRNIARNDYDTIRYDIWYMVHVGRGGEAVDGTLRFVR